MKSGKAVDLHTWRATQLYNLQKAQYEAILQILEENPGLEVMNIHDDWVLLLKKEST